MLNYVDHRAIFEGMNANLWSPNSGRLLWMTQPAWTSTMWQILSYDYDTQASFYGVKKACEPLHVQLNLATHQVDLINTTTTPHAGLTVSANVFSLGNILLFEAKEQKDVAADSSASSFKLDLAPYLARGMVLVQLQLTDATGNTLSENLYWLGANPSSNRELTRLSPVLLKASAVATTVGETTTIRVQLTNPGTVPSLANKLILFSAKDKTRILPAYFSDNYISLLPGQTRTLQIEYPSSATYTPTELAMRGWNATPQTIAVK